MQIGTATMENGMEVPLKTRNRTTIWPCKPTPGHIAREKHNPNRCMHPNIRCSTVYNSQDMEEIYMSLDREVDEEDVVHTYNGILLRH